ncbi:hypothetical protein ES708_28502 [subsurface metagenome]
MKEISTNVLIGRNSFAKWITLPSIIILVVTVVGPFAFLLPIHNRQKEQGLPLKQYQCKLQ